MRTLYILILVLLSKTGTGQLFMQHGAGLFMQENSSIYVTGDVNLQDSLGGTGKLHLTGNSVQWINLNGYSLPQLEINNAYGAKLTGPLSINSALNLKKGHLFLNGNELELSSIATIISEGSAAIQTDKAGMLHKKIDKDLKQYFIPLVSQGNYSRVLLTTRGKYRNGYVNVSSIGDASPNKPVNVEPYLNNYWKIDRSGISGDVDVTVDYSKYQNQRNNFNRLSGYYWANNIWVNLDHGLNSQASIIKAKITGDGGKLFAMNINKLVLYPNPANTSTRLIISSLHDEKATVNIVDSRGRIIVVQSLSLHKGLNQVSIDVTHLVAGSYNVRFLRAEKEELIKFIKL